ncbi:hypothetical protein AB6A40_001084 [Gnathostoma spinigerum]|uniref:Arginase n=1 Tax=Gnathostoma spinigerum TaxID=75299 RepID=A0ABD6E3E4_9BILA
MPLYPLSLCLVMRRTRPQFFSLSASSTFHPRQIRFIGCCNGVCGRYLGAEKAARKIRFSRFLKELNVAYRWGPMIEEVPTGRRLKALKGLKIMSLKLADATSNVVNTSNDLVVIGGDHSCAIGTWSGVANAVRRNGQLGLIWVDAHLDAHTPETSQSGNLHGTPVAHLLGYGSKYLANIFNFSPKILPKNLVYIGTRSYEAAEESLLKSMNVKIFHQKIVDNVGIEKVLNKAIDIVSNGTVGFGISIDVDGFRVEDAPGTGTPENGGIIAEEFLKAIKQADLRKLLATEIAEFMPDKDVSHKTERLLIQLINAIYVNKFSKETEEETKKFSLWKKPIK